MCCRILYSPGFVLLLSGCLIYVMVKCRLNHQLQLDQPTKLAIKQLLNQHAAVLKGLAVDWTRKCVQWNYVCKADESDYEDNVMDACNICYHHSFLKPVFSV